MIFLGVCVCVENSNNKEEEEEEGDKIMKVIMGIK
jgi:hypothetical protein